MDVSATQADGQPVGKTLLNPIGRTNLGWLLDTGVGRHLGEALTTRCKDSSGQVN
ncbi:hypothetical protein MYXA107069_17555 [Myxococcus xanthus]|nr:hypothetical protein MyxoNM_26320 [Myxococcus xanthus]SDX54294.1 hypothetical protein SAMN05444383_109151 [Myxococcus xanthus]